MGISCALPGIRKLWMPGAQRGLSVIMLQYVIDNMLQMAKLKGVTSLSFSSQVMVVVHG